MKLETILEPMIKFTARVLAFWLLLIVWSAVITILFGPVIILVLVLLKGN